MIKDKHIHYVSNKRLYEEYVVWYALIELAKEEGIEDPQIPPYIVDAMIKIATKLSYRPNFINYSFRDELISDALYDCIRFAKKFNPLKGSNPFSYITTICFNAFLRRIDKEKCQTYIKGKLVANSVSSDFFDGHCGEDDIDFSNQYLEFLREVGYADDSIPMSIKRSSRKKAEDLLKQGPLNEFEEE